MPDALRIAVPLAALALCIPAGICRAGDAPPRPVEPPRPTDRTHVAVEIYPALGISSTVRGPRNDGFDAAMLFGATVTGGINHVVAGAVLDLRPTLLDGTTERHLGVILGGETQLDRRLHGQLTGELGWHGFEEVGSVFLGGGVDGDTSPSLPYAGLRARLTIDSYLGAFVGFAASARVDLAERDLDLFRHCARSCTIDQAPTLEHWHVGGTEVFLAITVGWKL